MLRRINAAVFEAPAGARIQVVSESQSNNGVNDSRFEYAGTLLNRETILGLPGCSFTVAESSGRLQAVVAFDDNAPSAARYDLFEVENGALNNLGKFTLKSDGSPLIDFVIDPVEVAVPAAAAVRRAPSAAVGRKRAAKPQPTKAARGARKKPSSKAKPKAKARKPARKAAKTRRGGSRKRK